MSVNKVFLTGNMGKDPEINTFKDGGRIAKLALATKGSWVDRNTGERRTATEWHNVVLHGKMVDIAEKWVRKGMLLHIEGSIKYRQYQDQQGNTRYVTEIHATEMKMLSASPVSNQTRGQPSYSNNQPGNAGMNQGYPQNPQYTANPFVGEDPPPFYDPDMAF